MCRVPLEQADFGCWTLRNPSAGFATFIIATRGKDKKKMQRYELDFDSHRKWGRGVLRCQCLSESKWGRGVTVDLASE
jgi:hypothetical protein